MTEERIAELIAENAELRKRIVEVENQLFDAEFAAKMKVAGVDYIRRDEQQKVLEVAIEQASIWGDLKPHQEQALREAIECQLAELGGPEKERVA